MRPTIWTPKSYFLYAAKWLMIYLGIIFTGMVIFQMLIPMKENITESPGRLYYSDSGGLVQEITKIYTDGNGEIVKQELLYEYVGKLPEGKTIMLRSQDSPYTTQMVSDSSVPGVMRRK